MFTLEQVNAIVSSLEIALLESLNNNNKKDRASYDFTIADLKKALRLGYSLSHPEMGTIRGVKREKPFGQVVACSDEIVFSNGSTCDLNNFFIGYSNAENNEFISKFKIV